MAKGILDMPKGAPCNSIDGWVAFCELLSRDLEPELRELANGDDLSDATRAIAGLLAAGRGAQGLLNRKLVGVVSGMLAGEFDALEAFVDALDQAAVIEGLLFSAACDSQALQPLIERILGELPSSERGILLSVHLKRAAGLPFVSDLERLHAFAGPMTLHWLSQDTLRASLSEYVQSLSEVASKSGSGTLTILPNLKGGLSSGSDQ